MSYVETVAPLVLMVLDFKIGQEISSPISVNSYSWLFKQEDACYSEMII